MPEKRTFSINRSYGIFFLVLTILLGCLFILQTADIYFSALEARDAARAEVLAQAEKEGWNDILTDVKVAVAVKSIPIYSREIAGARLSKLAPYVCIWLAAVVGAIIIAIVHPVSPAGKRDPDAMLHEKLKVSRSRLPATAKEGQEEDFRLSVAQYQHIRKQSRILTAAVAVIALVCLLIPFLYFADFSHFPSKDINAEVAAAVLYALPFILVLLGGSIAYVYVQHAMMKKESTALKAAIAAGERTAKAEKKKAPILLVARLALLVIGVALFILGTQNGSMQEVFIKATKICTECIGLG